MRFENLEPRKTDCLDLGGKRVLMFIVAYNAETTIKNVLDPIPCCLRDDDVEVEITSAKRNNPKRRDVTA